MSMAVKTVKASNLSLGATVQDIKEFFSFSGEIEHVELQSENDMFQKAYVTFKDPQGAETALLLSGATIVDQCVSVALAPDYKSLASITSAIPKATEEEDTSSGGAETRSTNKAEDVVSSMIARGFILGKDALNKAKALDEKHQLTSTATAKVVSLDQKMGLSEKFSAGRIIVNDKVKEMDEKYQVTEKTKSAFTAAEQTVTSAGSAIMKNRYVSSGASWVTAAFQRAAKNAAEAKDKAASTTDHPNLSASTATKQL